MLTTTGREQHPGHNHRHYEIPKKNYWITNIFKLCATGLRADLFSDLFTLHSHKNIMEQQTDGFCQCTREPRGEAGLEGYSIGCYYRYKLDRDKNGKEFYRVFPGTEVLRSGKPSPNQLFTLDQNYNETTGKNLFGRYFTIKQPPKPTSK